ncbi:hypothetical protein ILYODFUR_031276, partial [Ilyodon furcidens]
TLHEEKTSHEMNMSSVRAHYEEETSQMKEGQGRALEEVAKKHRVTLENALTNAEKDKNRLLAVSTHTVTVQQADIHPSSKVKLQFSARKNLLKASTSIPVPEDPLWLRLCC